MTVRRPSPTVIRRTSQANMCMTAASLREDHLRLYHALAGMKGKFLLSYNDCPEIRELYKEYNFFDFKRVHSMVQKYEAGKEFPELLIANYDLFERERQQPHQLTLFDSIDKPLDYEKILKENIVCRIKR